MDNAVGIDIERHFDLRHSPWGGRNADQVELSEQLVVVRHLAFALEDANGHGRLIVGSRREDLTLFRRNGGIPVDQLGKDTAECLDPQREGCDVEEEHVLHFALEYAALNGGADGNYFVGIDTTVRFFSEELLDRLNDSWRACHAAYENHFLDVACGDAGVGEGLLAGFDRPFDQVVNQLFKFRAGQFHHQVFRSIGIRGDEGQIDLRFLRRGEFDLGPFRRFFQTLEGHTVFSKIDALIFLEFIDQPIHDALVEVVTAEVGIAVGRLDFEDAIADLENGDIEGAATQVIDDDPFVLLFVQARGEGCSCRFIDNTEDIQAGDLACIFGGL